MGGYIAAAYAARQYVAEREQSRNTAKAQAETQEAQNKMMWQQQEMRAKEQRDLLRRQAASARAGLAASGIGFGGGSGAALLEGMVRQAEDGIADEYGLTQARSDASYIAPERGLAQSLDEGMKNVEKAMSVLRPLVTK